MAHAPMIAVEQVEQNPSTAASIYRRVWGTPIRQALTITAIWRILIAVCGVVAHSLLPAGKYTSFSLIRQEGWPDNPVTRALDACVRNDAEWYGKIALHGYSYDPHRVSSIGFFPLFPVLMKLGAFLTGNVYIAGILTSNIALFLAVALLAVWLDDRDLGRNVPIITAFLLVYPGSLFFGVMYPESLHLLLVLAIFLTYERERWILASLGMFALLLLHPLGAVMFPCLAVQIWQTRSKGWRPWLPLAAGGLAIVTFAAYQYWRFGTPLAYMQTKTLPPWSATLHQAVSDLLLKGQPGIPPWFLGIMLGIGLLFLSLVPLVYRRFGPVYALFVFLTVVMRATSGLTGMERYVIVAFPVFAAVATTRIPKTLVSLFTLQFWFLLFVTMAFEAGWAIS